MSERYHCRGRWMEAGGIWRPKGMLLKDSQARAAMTKRPTANQSSWAKANSYFSLLLLAEEFFLGRFPKLMALVSGQA